VDLTRYIPHLDKESFAAGETVFARGDAGTSMYIVVEGEVDIDYDEQRSVRLGVGESFGEMSLIDKRPRSATVTAVTDVTLAPISQGAFLVLVQDTPYFALEVMQSLSNRLRANQVRGAED
jgi:CRP/FNR family transcriptional regulator, cyclic AMP receptor protein